MASVIEQLTTQGPDESLHIGISLGTPAPVTGAIPAAAQMSGMTRQQITRANNEACTVINTWLVANGYADWCCKYVDYDDPSRVAGSVWGNNICDVYTKLRLADGSWVNLFMLGPKNFAAKSVPCTTRDIKVCVSDPDGQNPRLCEGDEPMTLERVFSKAGQYFGYKGIKANTNLSLGPDEPVIFKNMAIFVQIHESEEVQVATFVENYQSLSTVATNAIFHFTAQGGSLEMDNAPPGGAKMLLTEAVDNEGKIKQYYTKIGASKRDLSQVGKETAQEAAQAVAEGKSCEVPMGINHADMKKGTGYITVIKPIEKRATHCPHFSPEAMISAAALDAYNTAPSVHTGSVSGLGSLGSIGGLFAVSSDQGPVYRSIGAPAISGVKRQASREPVNEFPATVSKQGRCYRGDYVCDATDLATKTPKATKNNGVATATHVHLVVTPPNVPPTVEDIKLCMEGLLMHELNLLGSLKDRHTDLAFKDMGATTESLFVEGAKGISATLKAHEAPVVGVPVF